MDEEVKQPVEGEAVTNGEVAPEEKEAAPESEEAAA